MADIYEISELQMIIRPILQNYGISRAYLFGSYANNTFTNESDLDFYIVVKDDVADMREGKPLETAI